VFLHQKTIRINEGLKMIPEPEEVGEVASAVEVEEIDKKEILCK
jgi:hypothetical protein